MRKRSQWA